MIVREQAPGRRGGRPLLRPLPISASGRQPAARTPARGLLTDDRTLYLTAIVVGAFLAGLSVGDPIALVLSVGLVVAGLRNLRHDGRPAPRPIPDGLHVIDREQP